MSSRFAAIAGMIVAAAGCSEDPALLIEVQARAGTTIELVPLADPSSAVRNTGEFRWFVVDAPDASRAPDPQGDRTATFLPDVRGTYLVERWFVYGVGEDLTHRFVIRATGAPPIASAFAEPSSVPVGGTAVIDGTASWSPEQRSLVHHWRLSARPFGSSLTIEPESAQTHVVPDVPGDYVIELSVFDGELWSDLPATVSVLAY